MVEAKNNWQKFAETLAGKWTGSGAIVDKGGIEYNETVEFKLCKVEPVVLFMYSQNTSHKQNGKPMHAENGFLKIFPACGKVEASYSHPFSLNEFEYGQFEETEDGWKWTMKAENAEDFQRPTKANSNCAGSDKDVAYFCRRYTLCGDILSYEMDMGTDCSVKSGPLHLKAQLKKQN